ncbi:MAG: hypothetical protein HKN70_05885 [Gammaproteobacteria bacterium]|nr:hypothetical protein [Gammaproteobacteria bacterium]
MDIQPWLVSEARRLTIDIKELQTDIAVIERKFQVEVTDQENTLPLGVHEWNNFKDAISDSCLVMIQQLEDFIDNRYQRQLHWSALRLLTASGVLSSEIDAYQSKLHYVANNPSEKSTSVKLLYDYFVARLQPTGAKFSLRLTQLISRVMDPDTWSVEADLTQNGDGSGNVRVKLAFRPETHNRRAEEREREKRLKRLEIDEQ